MLAFKTSETQPAKKYSKLTTRKTPADLRIATDYSPTLIGIAKPKKSLIYAF